MSGALETLRLVVPPDALEVFEAALRTVCPSVGFFRDGDDGPWTLEAVKERGAGEAELASALAVAAAVAGVSPALSREATAVDGWLARSLSGFPEQFVGRRFAIRGTHIAEPRRAGRITLLIDAGAAFGSGEHGSTRACLRALERLHHRPRRILDLGTGTGVLALAAARLLHRKVVAADIDPWSIRDASSNVARNGLRGRMVVGRADGWRSAWVRRRGPYDLVLANILARPLVRMAPALAHNLRPGGTAILSGLLVRQVPWVAGAHRAQGLVFERAIQDGDWAALVVRRPWSGLPANQPGRRLVLKPASNTRGISPRARPMSARS